MAADGSGPPARHRRPTSAAPDLRIPAQWTHDIYASVSIVGLVIGMLAVTSRFLVPSIFGNSRSSLFFANHGSCPELMSALVAGGAGRSPAPPRQRESMNRCRPSLAVPRC